MLQNPRNFVGLGRLVEQTGHSLIEAYRQSNDPDVEEKIDCCRRMATVIASKDGKQAAVAWLKRQLRLIRRKSRS